MQTAFDHSHHHLSQHAAHSPPFAKLPSLALATAQLSCAIAPILPPMNNNNDTMEWSDAPYAYGHSPSAMDSRAPSPPVSNKGSLAFILSDQGANDAAEQAEADAQAKKGSKFCIVEGCTSRAKHAKKCWKHGGSVKCKVPDCMNRAKSKGVCWSHGGGTACSFEGCDTIAVSHGFCWAHGGGKRCIASRCSKPAYERTENYCTVHYQEFMAQKQTFECNQGQ